MKKSHGGDKNDGFALTSHLIGARLHLLDSGYNFDGIHLKNILRPKLIVSNSDRVLKK